MPQRLRTPAALAMAAALTLPLAVRAQDAPKEPPSKEILAQVTAQANNHAGFDLLKRLKKDGTNTFLSPTSIGMCVHLATTAAGGATYRQMVAAMHADSVVLGKGNRALADALALDKDVTLRVANSVWSDPRTMKLNPEFADASVKFFDAEVRSVDFGDPATLGVINGWVGAKTAGKIPNLLTDVSPDTVCILVNAVYFKGAWTLEFKPSETVDADFATASGSRRIRLMSRRDDYRYAEVEGAQVIRLPYGQDGRFAMWVALPAPGKRLDDWMGDLDRGDLAGWDRRAVEKHGTIELPRFKMRFKEELNEELMGMGIQDAFVAGKADFSTLGENGGRGFVINKVIHEAILEVNEKGTEAAAATAIVMDGGAPPKPFVMRCDRPFFLAITDRVTGSVLFMGAVYEPESLE